MSTPTDKPPPPLAPASDDLQRHRNEELLGTEKIGRLLARMSVPAMFAMFINALYNVVDTIFIGRGVGALAIGGLTVAFPYQIFVIAVALMLGTGAASVVSRALGAGDHERAGLTTGTTIAFAAFCGVVLATVAFTLTDPILRLFGASEQLLPYATEYFTTVLFGTPFIVVAMAANNLIRAEGNAKVSMLVMLVGAVANIVLDPILIFGFGLGIRGAALATVIGQALSLLVTVAYFGSGRSTLDLRVRHLLPKARLLRPVLAMGLPAFIRQFGGSFLLVLVNNAALHYGGDLAIAAFGAINRLLIFALMPIFGLAQGYQPIAGYNYGAGRMDRVKQSTRITGMVAVAVTGFFFVVMVAFPRSLLSVFTDSVTMLNIAVPAMRRVVFVLPLVGLQVVGGTFFLAVGKAVPALFLGMLRQIILLIPMVAILPSLFGLDGLWIAFPIADTLAAIVTMGWLALFMRRNLGGDEMSTDRRLLSKEKL
ncbi:MAG: MATE family efflux transporter [Spirochaetia bacterium]